MARMRSAGAMLVLLGSTNAFQRASPALTTTIKSRQGRRTCMAQPATQQKGGTVALLYGTAAGCIATGAAMVSAVSPANSAVLGVTAMTLLTDFGPSASRDMSRSSAASSAAIDKYCAASGPAVLMDNFVSNIGSMPDDRDLLLKREALLAMQAANRYALYVRGRLLGDLLGAAILMRCTLMHAISRVQMSSQHVCFGASLMLFVHGLCWASGAAAARLDESAQPAPLSPALAKLIGCTTFGMAGAAALGTLAPSAWPRVCAVGAWVYSCTLLAIQAARLTADRLRQRIHVGL